MVALAPVICSMFEKPGSKYLFCTLYWKLQCDFTMAEFTIGVKRYINTHKVDIVYDFAEVGDNCHEFIIA